MFISNMSMKRLKRSAWIESQRIDIVVAAAFLCCGLCSCRQGYDLKEAELYITDSERQWAESVANGDKTVVERILADDFIGVDPKGQLYDKAKMVSETADGPKYFASNHLNDVKVRFYGDTAIAQGNESWERRNGVRGRFVWTDTWVRRDGQWQIVAAEDLTAPEPSASPSP
jgi:ketosteroid isomerase-like protein